MPDSLRNSAAIKLAAGCRKPRSRRSIGAGGGQSGAAGFISFLGGGYYRHYIPAAVRAITARAEFATSYTPYQPEASQGTTQAIFEFQTLITQLTGLEVANASMYDGASAAAEAVLMARRVLPKRDVVAISRALWPDYRATIRTYLSALGTLKWSRCHSIQRAARSDSRRWKRSRTTTALHGDRLSQRVRGDRTAGADRRDDPSRRRAGDCGDG